MKISARNVVEGTVESVKEGMIMANIKVRIESPEIMTAIITKEATEELGIKEGEKVKLVIKSTEVMVGRD
ncbi:MAG: TOBE domain-containing protein [Methanobacteriaceae archaeon]|jgi:molybdopterin-binding protein|nr:MAG: molybdenum-pterin-binding protein [Methanobacterium sp. BRmetb2]MCC7557666.1 TOBE domain-containing protein [Methanobacteriaceae archaeon]